MQHRARKRASAPGVTLIEVMIVVTILGIIAAGVALAAIPILERMKIQSTRTNAKELRRAAAVFRADGSDECPTPQSLRGYIVDGSSRLTDAWNNPFKIVCEPHETVVISFGPDKREETPDDIREPDPT